MRGQLVALRRIMRAAKPLEPAEVRRPQLGGDDQRAGHWSRVSCSSRSNPPAGSSAINVSPSTWASPTASAATSRRRRPRRPATRRRSRSGRWAAGHGVHAMAEFPRAAADRRLAKQRDREQGFAGRLLARLARRLRAFLDLAWRPSQRHTPNMLRTVRTALVHTSAGWSVMSPDASQASEPTRNTAKP